MKFYKENQVNPFGSCLPLVLQLPVFLSLFYMLRSDLKIQICGHALRAHHIITDAMVQKTSCQSVAPGSGKFLFIPDVTASATGGVLILLIVLYIGSQLVSSLMTTATVDRNQRLIALGLPFVFTIFILSFPAGLILYWITTNLWTVGQQFTVRRYFPPPALAGAGSDAGKLSLKGLFTRPDAAAKPPAGRAKAGTVAAKPAPGRSKPGAAGKGGAPPAATGAKRAAGGGAKASSAAAAKASSGGAAKASSAAAATASGDGAAKKAPAAAATTRATARRKGGGAPAPAKGGGAPAAAKGGGAAKEAVGTGSGDRDAKAPAAARPRGSAPPPPPRKKKKRSGRRR